MVNPVIPAFTMANYTALNEAIASGARSVSYDGRSVTYGSLSELLKIRALMAKELGLEVPGQSRRTVATFTRGFNR